MTHKALTLISILFLKLFNSWNIQYQTNDQYKYIKTEIKQTQAKLRKELYNNKVSVKYLDDALAKMKKEYLTLNKASRLLTLEEIYKQLKGKHNVK